MEPQIIALAHRAFCSDDVASLREILSGNAELRSFINQPVPGTFDSPPIANVKSRGMLDLLLEHGADINAKSQWWAGGFGLLHNAQPDLAKYAIERGASVDIHAAARLGMFHRVRELIESDAKLVHARGGDGQLPLHFASTREIASFLLENGADIDARDIDHESTAAQWMLGDRADLARFLVSRGCKTDLLMATALGDLALVQKHLDLDPESIRVRVTDEYFPMIGGRSGGTIYQWVIGWHVSAHQVAKEKAHDSVFELLMTRSPADVKLVNAAWLHDEPMVDAILRDHPAITTSLTAADRRQIAHAARNNDTGALRLFIKSALPLDARGQHNATPLHWAAWHGNATAVRLLLDQKPDIEGRDNDFNSPPIGWALHGSENGWHRETGDYPATVELLLRAGVKPPDKISGTPEVQAVLKRFSLTS